MDFAEIPIQVPEYFPDLIVTSYKRDSGSHADHNAVDFTLYKMPYGFERHSKYWFFYFGIIDMLWRNQRRGILRCAYPPNCPHYHLDVSTEKNIAGVELVKPEKDRTRKTKCIYKSHVNWDNTSGLKRIKSIEKFRSEVQDPWLPKFSDELQAELKYLFTANSKNLRVLTNGYIGAEDLQQKLDLAFGSGATFQKIGDTLAQWTGYQNISDARSELMEKNPWFWVAIAAPIGVGLYMLAREKHFWDLSPSKK